MNILYIITKSEMGGAQTHVLSLAEWMKKQGNTVAIMAAPGGWLGARSHELGIHYIQNPYFKNSYNPINLFRALRLVRKIIHETKPDIIHCHSGGGGFYGRLGSIGLSVKKVFTVHGWSFRSGVPIHQRVIGWLAEFLMRSFTDVVFCVSEFDWKFGIHSGVIGKHSSYVIHNGVSIPEQIALPGARTNFFTIVFAGRYAPPKRQDILVRALALLPEHIKNKIQIRLAGDGPQRSYLEELVRDLRLSDKVIFGSVPTERMSEVYQEADLLVLLSNYEAFPMVTIEAMSYGIPVLASDVGGVREAVDNTVGQLIPHTAPSEMVAKKLEELLIRPILLQSLGVAGRNRVIRQFSLEMMCAKVQDIYGKILGNHV